MSRIARSVLVLLATVCLDACGGPATVSPAVPSAAAAAALPALVLAGNVYNTALAPIAQARVDIIDGSQAGIAAVTNDEGRFEFSAPFSESSVTLRAAKDGYVTKTQVVVSQATRTGVPSSGVTAVFGFTGVYLQSVHPPVDLAGDYTVTFIADDQCSVFEDGQDTGRTRPNELPPDLRTRTYQVRIAATPPDTTEGADTRFEASVSGGRFLENYDAISVLVAGNDIRLDVNAGDAGLVERIGSRTSLAINGSTMATVTTPVAGSLSLPFRGWFLTCDADLSSEFNCPPPSQRVFCPSKHHQIVLIRR